MKGTLVWAVGTFGLAAAMAWSADIFTVDDGTLIRLSISSSGAARIVAADAAEPGLSVVNTGGGGGVRIDDGNAAAGKVWTALDATGRGTWQPAPGAGGGSEVTLANIALGVMRDAVDHGHSVRSLANGMVDEFEDELGVNTAASSNQTYHTAGDYYTNTPGLGPDLVDGTQTYSASSSVGGNGPELAADDTASTYWRSQNQVQGQHWQVQFSAARRIETYSFDTGNIGDWNNGNVSNEHLYGSSTGAFLGEETLLHTLSTPAGHYQYDATFNRVVTSPGSYTHYRILWQHYGGPNAVNLSVREVRMHAPNPVDMTLVSQASSASAQPDSATVVLWQEDLDAVTLNADLIAEASRDGGTTFSAVTLVQRATAETGRLLTGAVDISGQPAGASMVWRLRTANTKALRVHGVSLNWN